MRIRVANAVGGKPAGVYGGKAEAADFWAGEVKDRSRFDKGWESGRGKSGSLSAGVYGGANFGVVFLF